MSVDPVHPHRLEVPAAADPDTVYDAFTTWTTRRGLELYPAQDEGVVEVVSGSNLVLATPTGSGKSLVAVAAHLSALAGGRRTYYTAPIKALVSEKFFELVRTFGAERVGMVTGDASVNAGAPIIACTAEILANVALREGAGADVGQAVMDEFHYYGDHQRGWAWQVPLVELPHTQFVLMSATLGDTTDLRADLTRRTGRPTALVAGAERPVPLSYEFSMDPLHEALQELLDGHQSPVYVVHPTQAAAAERAQALMSVNVCSRDEKAAIAELIGDFRFTAGFGRTLSRLVRHGIGVHHAGMLPRYRRLVERLAQSGLLKVVCGTDTLGVGINVPIRTVLLVGLTKYDGRKVRRLNAREFHQISGRAGRAGFDTSGTVVVQAPEHVIEDHRAVLKAGDDPKKRRKVVRHKPPEGFVGWSQQTFENLVAAEPEPLQSRMMVSHAMLLNVISRPGDTLEHLRHLLRENQERPAAQVRLVRRAVQLYRELLAAGVVEQLAEPDETGRRARLTVDLQADFALDRPLSAFALAVFDVLDRESPTYTLDVLSVLEATLDDPMPVLMAQRNKARGEAVEQMKADGLEYEERVELVDEIGWPQPLADLLEVTFESYRTARPWLGATPPSPKSVVRDMHERALTFTETVSLYGLQRSEGLLLRYLSDAVRALRRTVPDSARTDELDELVTWLAEVVRQTDSSLLDEWEQLSHPEAVEAAVDARPLDAAPPPVTANARAFRVLVRNALFHRVELLARHRYADLGELDGHTGWTAQAWYDAMQPYREAHADIGTGQQARGPAMLQVDADTEPGAWLVRQVLDDPDGDHDWAVSARVDLAASDALGEPAVEVLEVGAL